MASTTTTGIKLEPAIKKRLIALGKKRDRSPHWLMKRAIVGYIDREERIEREQQEDEKRYQHYLKFGGIPHEKIEAWIDSLVDDPE